LPFGVHRGRNRVATGSPGMGSVGLVRGSILRGRRPGRSLRPAASVYPDGAAGAARAAIMAEWTSARGYAGRVANLSGTRSGPRANGDVFLIASGPGATVFATSAVDVLHGGSGTNWYFAKRSGFVTDIITGLHDGEIVEDLGSLSRELPKSMGA